MSHAGRTGQGGTRYCNPRQTTGHARSRYESYITMARDAASRGDTIEAENLYQHAEHYSGFCVGKNWKAATAEC
jgi:hypothetical protein